MPSYEISCKSSAVYSRLPTAAQFLSTLLNNRSFELIDSLKPVKIDDRIVRLSKSTINAELRHFAITIYEDILNIVECYSEISNIVLMPSHSLSLDNYLKVISLDLSQTIHTYDALTNPQAELYVTFTNSQTDKVRLKSNDCFVLSCFDKNDHFNSENKIIMSNSKRIRFVLERFE